MVSLAPEVYGPYVTTNKKGQQVLIVECLNAVYGTMVAALFYYKKFVKTLVKEGFKLNPYDRCVVNKIVNGKQLTICFHVKDCKILHMATKVVDDVGLNAETRIVGGCACSVLLPCEKPKCEVQNGDKYDACVERN